MAVSNAFLLILIENQHVEYKRLKRKTILSDKIDKRLKQKCKIIFGSKFPDFISRDKTTFVAHSLQWLS